MLRKLFILLAFCSGAATAQTPFATFDGASEPVLNDPHDLTFGPDGLLYIADKLAGEIVVMDPDTLEVVRRFGDGRLPGVRDISFGRDREAAVAVSDLSAIAIYDFPGRRPEMRNFFSGFPRTEGVLAHSNGRYYVMASGIGELVMLDPKGDVKAIGGHFGAHDVAEAPDGSIWVADNAARRLVRYSPSLQRLQVLEGPEYGFLGPRYLAVDNFGRLIVADQDAHRVLLIDPVAERLIGVIGDGEPGRGPGKFDDPEGVAVQGTRYFFSDSDNNRIVRYVVVLN